MGYYITIKNELLEPKHVAAMGPAVWLYMWLIDKVMAINENGIGSVLNGKPVNYEEHIVPDLGVPERTYQRWIHDLRSAGYIKTVRSAYGLIIVVTKAEKMWGKRTPSRNAKLFTDGSSAKNGVSKKSVNKTVSRQNARMSPAKTRNKSRQIGGSIIDNNNNKYINNNITTLARAPEKSGDAITKLYYEAVKALGLPTTNHNTVHTKIAQMKDEASEADIVTYLEFMRDKYKQLRPALNGLDYAPDVTEALHVYSKRLKIVEAFQRLSRQQQQTRVWRPRAK